MTLAAGTRLAHYEVLGAIGAGGMGEVYRARDTRLGREVALKVLPERFAGDAERLARFGREAQVLAALNHPHIAAIYGIEQGGGVQALVLELVEGQTLDERLGATDGGRRALPLDETLAIARHIAVALEAAHEQGIIHRDLKPSNIKITPQGTVKVLDFGLAKLAEPAAAASGSGRVMASQSPTITSPAMMTGIGLILGTAAYMSPEQAKGRPADRKSDIWAFGCVLFEMLTGTRAFEGEDVSDTMAAVLRAEPDWSRLPADTPAHVRTLVKRCLQKDPRRRLPDIGVARLEFDEAPAGTAAPAAAPHPPARSRVALVSIGVAAILALAAGAWLASDRAPEPGKRVQFSIPLDESNPLRAANLNQPALSISNEVLVFSTGGQLHLRRLQELQMRPVSGSADTGDVVSPALSPDGQRIAYVSLADRTLKTVPVEGGVPQLVAELRAAIAGIGWTPDGAIVFGQGTAGGDIMKVSANGGQPTPLVAIDGTAIAYGPQILPGGKAVLFTLSGESAATRWDNASIVVQRLDTGERFQVASGADARYVAATGHIVYALAGTLYAVPFDASRLTPTGEPAPVLPGVRRSPIRTGTPVAQYAFSSDGTLAYMPGPVQSTGVNQLAIVDISGARDTLSVAPDFYEAPRISPDQREVAVAVESGAIYVFDLAAATRRRLPLAGNNRHPVWAPESDRIAYQSVREGGSGIFLQRTDGSVEAEQLTTAESGTEHIPEAWSLAGNLLSYTVMDLKSGECSLWLYTFADRKSARFGTLASNRPFNSDFAPDGRFIAYTERIDTAAVKVASVPPGTQYEVSRNDQGHHPLFARHGRGLIYFPGAGPLVAVDVDTAGRFAWRNYRPVPGGFSSNVSPESPRNHDMFRDGRILFVDRNVADGGEANDSEIRVVLNWFDELRRLAPAAR